MKNKKILFFIGASYVSGLEVVTLHLIRGLKERDYDVQCIFNGWNDGDFKQRLDSLNVPSYELKLGWLYLKKPMWTLDSIVHFPKAYFQCRKILKKIDPDVCHFCNYSIPILIYPLIKKKSVFNLQESLLPSKKHNTIFGMLNKKVSIFTAVSKQIIRILEDLNIPSEKIKLIYNGIPKPEVKPKAKEQITTIGIVGQVRKWKGHQTLIAAAENLIKNNISNFKVLIYGNDQNEFGAEMKNLIKEKGLDNYFTWMGFVKNQEAIYSSCDVIVVPTLTGEPCSLTIIESMFHSKAVVVSDRGGNPELVKNGESGLVFKGDNPEELSQCLAKLISNPSLQDQLGEKGLVDALKNHGYLTMTDHYIDIYETL